MKSLLPFLLAVPNVVATSFIAVLSVVISLLIFLALILIFPSRSEENVDDLS
jgi:hypothetical protein